MISAGDAPWRENQLEEDPVRPESASADEGDGTRSPSNSGERRRKDKGESEGIGDEGVEGDNRGLRRWMKAGSVWEDKVEPSKGSGEASKDTGDKEEKDVGMRKPKIGRIPKAPTKRGLEEHLPLHMPYKSWCPICVSGEGIHNQSRRATEEERERLGTTISLDYCYLTTEGESEEDPKVLVMHDDQLETLWALGVKQKGVTPEVVSWIVQKLDEAGYRGMAITIKH